MCYFHAVLGYPFVSFWLLVALAILGQILPNPQADDESMAITLRLDKAETTPGESVELKALIPAKMDAKVRAFKHIVLRLGYYDSESSKLMYFTDRKRFSPVNTAKAFDDLRDFIGSHAFDFNVAPSGFANSQNKGRVYKCQPKRLGVFMIVAEWHLDNQEVPICSNPVILVVKPPLDNRGSPIIKKEWLVED
jgi:hypothetical protein